MVSLPASDTQGTPHAQADDEATLPEGANDQLVRTVTENSRTLGFETYEFEKE